jgi:hypothetical protein
MKNDKIAPLGPRFGIVIEEVEERVTASLPFFLSRLITSASPVTDNLTLYSTGFGDPETKTFSFSTIRPLSVSVAS